MPSHAGPNGSIRVLRIITRLNIGGPSIQAIELTTRLVARGYRTTLAHGSLDEREGDMRYLLDGRAADGIEIHHARTLRRPIAPAADIRAAADLFTLIRRVRPHIVHTHMAKAGSLGRLATLVYNRSVGRGDRARLVHTYHGHVLEGYFSVPKTRVVIGIERMLARATDRLIAISPQIRRELVEKHRIGRDEQYRTVPLGFDLAPFAAIDADDRGVARRALGIDNGVPVVTTVGRLTAIKQQTLFLEVARRVLERYPNALMLIAGDGDLRNALEMESRRLGINNAVRFLGWRRDLEALYAATDVFLLTSRNEGTPVALIEAMATGCAGVSTDVGGVRDVITDESTGRLAAFGDVDALSRQVLDLLGDAALRARVAAAGRALVLRRFTIDRLVDDVDGVYRELLT